jgi:hypothetical protein
MTTALNTTTRPATISGVLTSAGKYLTSLASNQLDQAGQEVTELSFACELAGRKRKPRPKASRRRQVSHD